MSYHVLLVNRYFGGSHQQYPVSGKSGKNYGLAFFEPNKAGLVFKMSAQDYDRDKFDLVGNERAGCQWVPEFVQEEAPPVPASFGVLGCQLCALPATAVADNLLYCDEHAPTDSDEVTEVDAVRLFLEKRSIASLRALAKEAGINSYAKGREKLIDELTIEKAA